MPDHTTLELITTDHNILELIMLDRIIQEFIIPDHTTLEPIMSDRIILELLMPNSTTMELNIADHTTRELIIAIPTIAEVIITVLIKADHLATEPPAEVLRMTVIAAVGRLVADKTPDHMQAWDHDMEIVPEQIKQSIIRTSRTVFTDTNAFDGIPTISELLVQYY
ncbi:hypothetical protein MMC22_001681 [Lobaria immixta]|nr:hypothetical protein [Lobaria immixta]